MVRSIFRLAAPRSHVVIREGVNWWTHCCTASHLAPREKKRRCGCLLLLRESRGEVDVSYSSERGEEIREGDRRGDKGRRQERGGGCLLPETLLLSFRILTIQKPTVLFFYVQCRGSDVRGSLEWERERTRTVKLLFSPPFLVLYRRGNRPSPSLYQDNKHIEVGNTARLVSAFFTQFMNTTEKVTEYYFNIFPIFTPRL